MLHDQGRLELTDIAKELVIARSTAHRLLAMLVYRDFAIQDEHTTSLPGPRLGLGRGQRRRLGPARTARPRLARHGGPVRPYLGDREPHGQSRHQSPLPGQRRVPAAAAHRRPPRHIPARRPHLRRQDGRGTILPAHRASDGKVPLPALPSDQLAALYPALPDQERANLLRELRRDPPRGGYAPNLDGTEQGVSAIGAALRNSHGTSVGALSISTPSAR
ncbi:IclR family transcriptional regulator C-terminal domain-containing protein [Nonomuraea sp. NPDC052265]|uniref:helix-turn-helix domain-containing protein n=1 Tax=Nonomuraea sp. NPDC052265 TaxID=3364374 RepID=UPI0037C65085